MPIKREKSAERFVNYYAVMEGVFVGRIFLYSHIAESGTGNIDCLEITKMWEALQPPGFASFVSF